MLDYTRDKRISTSHNTSYRYHFTRLCFDQNKPILKKPLVTEIEMMRFIDFFKATPNNDPMKVNDKCILTEARFDRLECGIYRE